MDASMALRKPPLYGPHSHLCILFLQIAPKHEAIDNQLPPARLGRSDRQVRQVCYLQSIL